jgi:PPM family protein phosphatase
MSGEAQLVVCGRSDVGRQRTNNEDALLAADAREGTPIDCANGHNFDISDGTVLLAVTDGMGGENAGEVASRFTLASLRHALSKELGRNEPPSALYAAIEHAHAVVTGAAASPGREGMGATLVAALVHRDHAYVGAVGDSRVYVLRHRRLVQVTKDQSFLQYLIDAGAVPHDQIASFPHKNVILQAVGRATELSIPISRIALRRGDGLLLCTDGLTGELSDETIAKLASDVPVDVACKNLIDAANAQGGHDNITVVFSILSGASLLEAQPDEAVAAMPVDLRGRPS